MSEDMKQFDLEQSIMECWNIKEDLDVLLEAVIENENFTKDQISNVLLGLVELYDLKFDKCFRNFEAFLADYYEMRKMLENEVNSHHSVLKTHF